jgi:hypothetical protein
VLQERDELALGLRIPLNVALRHGQTGMAGELLHVLETPPYLRDFAHGPSNKGAAPGMRRTAVHFQRRIQPMKPQAHGRRRQPPSRSENRIGRSGVAMSPRVLCNVTRTAWRSGCKGMVRPPVLPLLARFGTCNTSATCPYASVPIAQVSEALSLARSPVFIDNRNMTRSRAG